MSGQFKIADVLNKMHGIRTELSFGGDLTNVLKKYGVSQYRYNQWERVLAQIKVGKLTKNPILIKAATTVLSIEPRNYSLMRYCPRDKQSLDDNLGHRKETIKQFGQLVRVYQIKPRSVWFEIVDHMTGEFCGQAHKSELIKLGEQLPIDRLHKIKGTAPTIDDERNELIEEIDERAARIKERNERRRQIEHANKRREREEKKNRAAARANRIEEMFADL